MMKGVSVHERKPAWLEDDNAERVTLDDAKVGVVLATFCH